jgi:hypothetical protein
MPLVGIPGAHYRYDCITIVIAKLIYCHLCMQYRAYTVVTEKSIYREYMEVAVFHSEL